MQKQKLDIRAYKGDLRNQAKEFRRTLPLEKKESMDRAIESRVRALYQYRRARTFLCYVSTPIEVDTRALITAALADGKQVAVPRCVDGTRQMEFYLIRSFDDLERRTFGVLEPKVPGCKKLQNFENSICIVPALLYDHKGYRLGYGAGYYDRFLSGYKGYKVGISYGDCVRRHLLHGRYDVPVDMLVTEDFIRVTDRGKKKKKADKQAIQRQSGQKKSPAQAGQKKSERQVQTGEAAKNKGDR